ncbi:TIGR03086 family metal-binding protein [Luteipulveratus halotolerans]|uniref:Mycothiol-dependent maleylpyruvate isomerase metal-binding domain-containing protein n=1 Tax=Luteipulveratus halotolerans TaxID=1631356 RepID=A0A0L6CN54_9MICO|nr:TIGR03086 family metal-binding protein [Luteipulveratus halotolerans]KNX39179.1 hypothetical protein VV01_03990 [Luteipulveratus halotolerans]
MPTTSTPTIPDLRPQLRGALAQVDRLMQVASTDQAHRPTPCADFDVKTLIEHLQGVVRRLATILSGEHFSTAPPQVASTDWAGDWRAGVTALEPLLADDANLDRSVEVPWGRTTGRGAIASYVGEITVHSWDLAAAIGRTDDLDPELATTARQSYVAILPEQPRGGAIPFGPVVPVSEDAGAYERLVAWTGRDPHWS